MQLLRIASIACAMVILAGTPAASSDTETVVLTAPYAAGDTESRCGELAGCVILVEADRDTGRLSSSVHVAGAHVDMGTGPYGASGGASVTATHAIADVPDHDVTSISYDVEMTLEGARLTGLPNTTRVLFEASARHTGDAALAGALLTRVPFIAGIIVHLGGPARLRLEVTGAGGAPIPPGSVELQVKLAGIVSGPHAGTCAEVCVDAGGAAGSVDVAMRVDRITAQISRVRSD